MSDDPQTMGVAFAQAAKDAGGSEEPTCYEPANQALAGMSADDKTALVVGWRSVWSPPAPQGD